jgi:hypothetical protein
MKVSKFFADSIFQTVKNSFDQKKIIKMSLGIKRQGSSCV